MHCSLGKRARPHRTEAEPFPTLLWCTRFRKCQGCLQSNSHQHNASCRTPSEVRSLAPKTSLYLEPPFKNMFYVTIIFCTEILRNPLKPQDWNTLMKLSVIKNKWIFAFFYGTQMFGGITGKGLDMISFLRRFLIS